MCESVDLIPLVESEALVLEMPIPEEMYPETVELVEFLANVPKWQ
jgi:type III secretion system FlhB-like substrate exporter